MSEEKENHLHDQYPVIYIKLLSTQWGFVQFYMEMFTLIIPLIRQSWALSMSCMNFCSSHSHLKWNGEQFVFWLEKRKYISSFKLYDNTFV